MPRVTKQNRKAAIEEATRRSASPRRPLAGPSGKSPTVTKTAKATTIAALGSLFGGWYDQLKIKAGEVIGHQVRRIVLNLPLSLMRMNTDFYP